MHDNLAAWLAWIEQQHHSAIDLGLARVRRVYQQLNLPRCAKHIVTVAGTNGKGSTIAALEALLRAADLQVATYTSPHVLIFNERIVINGQAIDDQSLCQAFEQVLTAQQQVQKKIEQETIKKHKQNVKNSPQDISKILLEEDQQELVPSASLSFFEFTTLAALLIFAQQNLDVLLLEVGLGGRLDAVNLIDPDIAVVTSIALDHQDWLGNDLHSIAFEKAGILRQGIKFVCGQTPVTHYLKHLAQAQGCQSYFLGERFKVENCAGQMIWQMQKNDQKTVDYPLPALQLPLNSVACALAVFSLLDYAVPAKRIMQVLHEISLIGRYQKFFIANGARVIFDVAHNPAAVELLSQRLCLEPIQGRVLSVFAALKDKDIATMVDTINSCIDTWYVATIDHPRAQSGEILLEQIRAHAKQADSVRLFASLDTAFKQALEELTAEDVLLCFGSFHVVAELLKYKQNAGLVAYIRETQ